MKKIVAISLLSLAYLAACATTQPMVSATLEPRSGSNATGTVSFRDLGNGDVEVRVDITGTTPGQHGFHIHETGDCSAPDATSAGPHFNPTNMNHGAPSTGMHHAGDFGNLTADANGVIRTTFRTRWISLDSSPTSAIGKAVILHEKADDLTSQPAGNAGARIACGVVTTGGM